MEELAKITAREISECDERCFELLKLGRESIAVPVEYGAAGPLMLERMDDNPLFRVEVCVFFAFFSQKNNPPKWFTSG